MFTKVSRRKAWLIVVACAFVLGGCASRPANPDDPLERYNRAMYAFNDGVDKTVIRPVAQVYDSVTPRLVQTGVGNFFGNLGDLWVGLNNLLQGKAGDGLSDWMRFMVNTSLGIFGVLDVATEMGLPKNDEDFGQTLAVWGVGEGPYVVLPLFGSRTLRDATALPVDWVGDPVTSIDHTRTRYSARGVRLVHDRANLLGIDKTLDEALDPYSFARDFYLQQRRYKVHDGNPPVEYEDFDLDDNGVSTLPLPRDADLLSRSALERLQLVSLFEADARSTSFVIR